MKIAFHYPTFQSSGYLLVRHEVLKFYVLALSGLLTGLVPLRPLQLVTILILNGLRLKSVWRFRLPRLRERTYDAAWREERQVVMVSFVEEPWMFKEEPVVLKSLMIYEYVLDLHPRCFNSEISSSVTT